MFLLLRLKLAEPRLLKNVIHDILFYKGKNSRDHFLRSLSESEIVVIALESTLSPLGRSFLIVISRLAEYCFSLDNSCQTVYYRVFWHS